MMSEIYDKCKVYFNKERNYFELRMPDGSFIPSQLDIKLEDELSTVSGIPGRLIATVRYDVEWGGETSGQEVNIERPATDPSWEKFMEDNIKP